MMKKRAFKKNLALGVLIACSLTGPVYADSVDVASGEEQNTPPAIIVNSGESFKNAGTVIADSITVTDSSFENSGTVSAGNSITVINSPFTNSGDITTKTLSILGRGNRTVTFNGGTITASGQIIYQGTGDNGYSASLGSTILDTPELIIQGAEQKNQIGLGVTDSSNIAEVGKITINSTGGKTGLTIDSNKKINITAPVHLRGVDTEDARIEVYEGATLTVGKIISEAGRTKVQLNGDKTTAILDNITVQDGGNFSLQTLGDETKTSTFKLHTITVGNNAQFKTSIYQNTENDDDISCSEAVIAGDDVTIKLGQKAKADFGGVGDGTKTDWRGDMIDFQVENLTINLDSTAEYNYATMDAYKADYNKGVYIHVNNEYNPLKPDIGCDQIRVVGAGTANTGDLENDLQRLAYVVKITKEIPEGEYENLPEILAPTGATVEQQPGGIQDGGTGTVDKDGTVTNIKPTKNPDVFGTEEIGALGLLSWRTELSDMNRRLGELRDSTGEHGLWVRMIRGENDYRSLDSQHNIYQIGYDRKLSSDPHWTLGAAFSYTDGEGSYDTGRFDMSHKTLTLYGSRLNDDGSYIDIVGKYSRLNHDLENTWGSGDYDADAYSLGVEVGKRFTQESGFWIEPQAQLIYGYVGSASYDAGDIHIAQDSMQSLIGRAGVRLGKDFDKGNVYLRASYLYDFDGDTGVTFTDAQVRSRDFDQDLGGGWCEIGLGTNINLSDTTHLYFDIEKTFGGEIATTWQWNAGMRWSF